MSGVVQELFGSGSLFTASGRIAVRTEKGEYFGGEVMNGAVYLELKERTQASSVTLRFHGYEHCHWNQTHSNGKETWTEHHEGGRDIARLDVCLASVPMHLEPGTYTYPFSLQLPPQVPGSFTQKDGGFGWDYGATIAYTITATVDVPGLLKPNITSTQILSIKEVLQAPIVIDKQRDVVGTVTTCCCCTGGQVHIRSFTGKSAYVRGETMQVCAQVNNMSKSGMKNVQIKVTSHLRLTSHPEIFGPSVKHFDNTVFYQKSPNPDAFKPGAGAQQMSLNIPLPLDERLQPTVSGAFVQHGYTVDVICNPGTCSKNIKCETTVTLYAPQPQAWGTYWGPVLPPMPPGPPPALMAVPAPAPGAAPAPPVPPPAPSAPAHPGAVSPAAPVPLYASAPPMQPVGPGQPPVPLAMQ